jgi:beta-phosphoglucomutase family hydrolase
MKAVIFDKDGVLSETFDLHAKAHLEVLAANGVKANVEDIAIRYGKLTSEILKEIMEEHGKLITKETSEKMAIEKDKIYMKLAENELRLLSGVKAMLEYLRNKNYKIGLASSSSPGSIEQLLRVTNIKEFFDATISGWEIKSGKPDPEIFLECAKRLNIEPKECVVVEDSIHGVEAAKRAGMKCIAVTTGQHKREELQKMKPDWVLNTLEEFNKIEEL